MTGRLPDVDVVAEILQCLTGKPCLAPPTDETQAVALIAMPHGEVVERVQRRHQPEVLMHEAQTSVVTGAGHPEREWLSINEHFGTRVRARGTRQAP